MTPMTIARPTIVRTSPPLEAALVVSSLASGLEVERRALTVRCEGSGREEEQTENGRSRRLEGRMDPHHRGGESG